jgi:hypothetical protein
MTVPAIGGFSGAEHVLAKAILQRIGVATHRSLRQVLALPGLDRRRRRVRAPRYAAQRRP